MAEYQVRRTRRHIGCGGLVSYRFERYFCQRCGHEVPVEAVDFKDHVLGCEANRVFAAPNGGRA